MRRNSSSSLPPHPTKGTPWCSNTRNRPHSQTPELTGITASEMLCTWFISAPSQNIKNSPWSGKRQPGLLAIWLPLYHTDRFTTPTLTSTLSKTSHSHMRFLLLLLHIHTHVMDISSLFSCHLAVLLITRTDIFHCSITLGLYCVFIIHISSRSGDRLLPIITI